MIKVKYILVFLLMFFTSSSLFGATGTIKGSVFEDLNLNQKRDIGEGGTGVHTFVKLCRDDVWVDSYEINSSNADGSYEFTISDFSKYTIIHDDSNTSSCTMPTDHTVHNEKGWSSSSSHFREVIGNPPNSIIAQDFAKFRDDHDHFKLDDMKKAYLFQNKPTDVYSIDLVTGDLNKVADNITPYSGSYSANWHINGLGFNVIDGFMWGSTPMEKKIARIGKDSSGNWVQIQFNEIEGLNIHSYTGDIDDNGTLYILNHSSYASKAVKIVLNPESKDYLKATSLNLVKKGTLITVVIKSTDWAVNPIDGMLYTVNNGTGLHYLWRIDPQTGEAERLGDAKISNSDTGGSTKGDGNMPPGHPLISGKSRVFGGSFFTGDGYYYLYDNGPGRHTGEVFRIDITDPSNIDPTAVPFSKPRKTSLNDGVMWAGNFILLDFGDAPDDSNVSSGDGTKEGNYRTLLSDNGPRHTIPYSGAIVYLGANPPDFEDDANATKDALGDDNDDGVTFEGKTLQGAEIVANSKIDLEITTTGNGDLNAWIDWNSDGNFTSSEQIATDEDGFSGSISLKDIKVPSKMKTDVMSVARFRYSTDKGLEATGPAKDGEVEDYMINIVSGNEFGVWDTNLSIANQIITTKIVNQDINLTIASLDKNNSKFMTSSYENVKAAIFANSKQLTVWKDVNLTDTNSTDVMFGKIDEAHKIAYVRVKYGDANITSDLKDANLSEQFAIRPDKFEIGSITGPLLAGKEFDLSITAVGVDGIATKNYNETSTGYKISLDEEQNLTCTTGDTIIAVGSKFSDGSFGAKATYSEVGSVVASITDIGFASIDINDTSASQRLITSASSPPIVFNAANFDVKWNFVNRAQVAKMTYFSSMPDGMGARLDIELQAKNFLGANLKNYTASCYASDIATKVNFNIFGTEGSRYTPTWLVDIDGGILVSLNPLVITFGVANGGIVAGTFKNRFSNGNNGQANTSVHINLRRNQRFVSNPVNLVVIDVNATDINTMYESKYDSEPLSMYESSYGTEESSYGSPYKYRDGSYVNKDNLNGSAFGFSDTSNTASLDNANFYYGRVHSPDYQAVGIDFNATLFYEVYCRDCNRVNFPKIANARESVDSVFWYILTFNDFDNLGVGVNNPVYSRGGLNIANVTRRDVITLQANQTPYTDRIIYRTAPWLLYNRFRNVTEHSFLIEHHSPTTTWSGKGEGGERMEQDASRRKSEKMDW